MAKSKKRLKLEEEKPETTTTVNMDWISSLPDSVLCHILSFLPTRSSMATSILSRRWRHLWKDLQVLDIDDKPFHMPGGEKRFVAFVKEVLARRNSRHIQKFRLSCDLSHSHRRALTRWIRAVTGPHLQELRLSLSVYGKYGDEDFDLPRGVFVCKSLVSLVLNCSIYLDYDDDHFPFVHLPSLKNLELDVSNVNPDKLLSGCPVVENLKLVLHDIINFSAIHMPRSLKSLTLEDGSNCSIQHLEIDTPSLEYLYLEIPAHHYSQVLFSNFPNMVEAHLDIYPDEVHVDWVLELLRAICMTKLLVLKDSTVECLLHAPALDIPEFCRLAHLELGIPCFDTKFLINLLHNCNMLQVLIIHNRQGAYLGTLECSTPSGWTPPTKVPNCVISHLETFEFGGYKDSADEHAFIAYLIQRGVVLKTMTIHTDGFGLEKKFHILKKLSTIPRGSNTCQLKFE